MFTTWVTVLQTVCFSRLHTYRESGTGRNRICDAWIFGPTLYQLSYRSLYFIVTSLKCKIMKLYFLPNDQIINLHVPDMGKNEEVIEGWYSLSVLPFTYGSSGYSTYLLNLLYCHSRSFSHLFQFLSCCIHINCDHL